MHNDDDSDTREFIRECVACFVNPEDADLSARLAAYDAEADAARDFELHSRRRRAVYRSEEDAAVSSRPGRVVLVGEGGCRVVLVLPALPGACDGVLRDVLDIHASTNPGSGTAAVVDMRLFRLPPWARPTGAALRELRRFLLLARNRRAPSPGAAVAELLRCLGMGVAPRRLRVQVWPAARAHVCHGPNPSLFVLFDGTGAAAQYPLVACVPVNPDGTRPAWEGVPVAELFPDQPAERFVLAFPTAPSAIVELESRQIFTVELNWIITDETLRTTWTFFGPETHAADGGDAAPPLAVPRDVPCIVDAEERAGVHGAARAFLTTGVTQCEDANASAIFSAVEIAVLGPDGGPWVRMTQPEAVFFRSVLFDADTDSVCCEPWVEFDTDGDSYQFVAGDTVVYAFGRMRSRVTRLPLASPDDAAVTVDYGHAVPDGHWFVGGRIARGQPVAYVMDPRDPGAPLVALELDFTDLRPSTEPHAAHGQTFCVPGFMAGEPRCGDAAARTIGSDGLLWTSGDHEMAAVLCGGYEASLPVLCRYDGLVAAVGTRFGGLCVAVGADGTPGLLV